MSKKEGTAPLPPVHEPEGPDIGGFTPEELALARELEVPGLAKDLEAKIADLEAGIEARRLASFTQLSEKLNSELEVRELRSGGTVLENVWKEYDRRRQAVEKDPKLNSSGWEGARREALEEAANWRNEKLAAERERLTKLGALLEERHPPPPPRYPDPAEGVGLALLFTETLPEDFLADRLRDLAILARPALSEDEEAARRRLELARPYLRRRAVAPERHSAPFQHVYAKALAVVDSALAGGGKHHAAREHSEGFRNAWDSVSRVLEQAGGWDATTAHLVGGYFQW